VFGVAMLLASGAALVVARWQRSPVPPLVAPANRSPKVVARNPVSVAPARGGGVGSSRAGDVTAEANPEAAETPQPTPGVDTEIAQAAGLPPSPELPSASLTPARPVARKTPSKAPRAASIRSAVAAATPPPEVPRRTAATGAVREFYAALGQGDGAKAAAVVAPEAREDGPLSAASLTQFYSSLRVPIRVTKIDPINDDTVFVRYQFVTRDDRLCLGSATVDTTNRDGGTLIRGIRTFDAC
jgi:hypothetical protein